MNLTVGSLFSGIGGLDLGLERAGMTVKWQSEIDPYCTRVLAKHWPDVPNLGDVTTIDWSTVGRVDLICGGYPCQPFSLAARGRNPAPNLWPAARDAIAHLRPRFALLENVAAHTNRGMGRTLGDLHELGFDAEWSVVPACALGAPHTRRRLFILAHAHSEGQRARTFDAEVAGAPHVRRTRRPWPAAPERLGMAHGVPHRMDRLRALGNAVVPQVAEWIGERILEAAA